MKKTAWALEPSQWRYSGSRITAGRAAFLTTWIKIMGGGRGNSVGDQITKMVNE